MSLEYMFFASGLLLSSLGIYLNLCYQRATHRSTVYAKFSGKNLRFLSIAQIVVACSNIVAVLAMWTSKVNRTKKSEAFFSCTMSIARALPALTLFWTTVERVWYNRSATIRDDMKFRHVALFRIIQIMASTIMELLIRTIFLSSDEQIKIAAADTAMEISSDDASIKNTLISNYYYDYYHGLVFIPCIIITVVMYNSAKSSHARAGLLGGMRNDKKINNLAGQIKFFKKTYLPLYFACLTDYLLQLIVKRGLDLDESIIDVLYVNARCYLPIMYPLSLIAFNKTLRTDYFTNFILCRKARNLHKESKVKVIATRESQESIIANLKMIGILSDVDTSQVGVAGPTGVNLAMMGMATGSTSTQRPTSGMGGQRVSISKDPTSTTSMGSVTKTSVSSMTGGGGAATMMMFHTRPKNSVPSSIGSVG